tara:strand:- start:50 stop:355 length:306 start_codon:yes stop_codon:yes gene_type:complete
MTVCTKVKPWVFSGQLDLVLNEVRNHFKDHVVLHSEGRGWRGERCVNKILNRYGITPSALLDTGKGFYTGAALTNEDYEVTRLAYFAEYWNDISDNINTYK